MGLDDCLRKMKETYEADPLHAVRSQEFIRLLHSWIADELRQRLHPKAKRTGIEVKEEAKIYGSHKAKKVDVAVIDPMNGPLAIIGVRSQMSSIGNNVVTYHEGIVGECTSLQDRFPLATYGYAYLMPLKDHTLLTVPDHVRFARMYQAISGREGRNYRDIKGVYDHFAYLVVDFDRYQPIVRDDIMSPHLELDLSIHTLVDRCIKTFNDRNTWMDIFI